MSEQLEPNDIRFFCGTSNPQLAQDVADYLSVSLEDTEISRFSNDNLFVQLGSSVRGRVVYILQSLTPPVSDHLMQLLMMLDIAKSAAAREVHAIIPYFSYARSDKKDAPRISITGRLVADLLKTAGATHVMTMRLHSPQVHGFFSIPTDPLTARPVFIEHLSQRNFDPAKTVVVAPDMGTAKQTARFARALSLPFASANKTRISDTEVQIATDLLGRQVSGYEHAIVYDDEIATGGSAAEVSDLLVACGIKRISLICTHGLFLGPAVERLAAIPEIVEIITTDTVAHPADRRPDNMTVLSVSSIFGRAIQQNYGRESIGDLFTFWEDD